MSDKIFVVDMQHHYIPSGAIKLVGKTEEHDFTYGLQRFKKEYEEIADTEIHLKWMEESGIDVAILSTGSFVPNGHEFCKACNDGYSETIRKYPSRFRGMIHVYPFHDKKSNQDEIRRAVEELGLWGIAAVTSFQNMTIDSPMMDHIYEMAIKYDMPVFVHPTIRKNLWGGERYDLFMTVTREYDIVKSFVEMVYGVLPRFPKLKIIMAHFGGGLPALKGRLLAWHRPEGIPIPDDVPKFSGLSIKQAGELGLVQDFDARTKNIYFDSAGFGGWPPVIKSAFETLGPDRICFGSDYPYEMNNPKYVKEHINEITGLDISKEDKEKFLCGNLKQLFRIQ